jgi:hypothetical protein
MGDYRFLIPSTMGESNQYCTGVIYHLPSTTIFTSWPTAAMRLFVINHSLVWELIGRIR